MARTGATIGASAGSCGTGARTEWPCGGRHLRPIHRPWPLIARRLVCVQRIPWGLSPRASKASRGVSPCACPNGNDRGQIPGPARLARNGNFAHRRAASGPCLAFIKMASDHPAAAEVGHWRIDLAADGHDAGAAQVEVAAGGRAARRRHVALEADAGRTA